MSDPSVLPDLIDPEFDPAQAALMNAHIDPDLVHPDHMATAHGIGLALADAEVAAVFRAWSPMRSAEAAAQLSGMRQMARITLHILGALPQTVNGQTVYRPGYATGRTGVPA
jgi:hypothetical protein